MDRVVGEHSSSTQVNSSRSPRHQQRMYRRSRKMHVGERGCRWLGGCRWQVVLTRTVVSARHVFTPVAMIARATREKLHPHSHTLRRHETIYQTSQTDQLYRPDIFPRLLLFWMSWGLASPVKAPPPFQHRPQLHHIFQASPITAPRQYRPPSP